MDNGFLLVLWAVRLLFLGLIYLFLFRIVRALLRDLRAAAREPSERPGRLVVLASPSGEPPAGQAFGLEVITALGRDVNNAIVIEDPFASADHAVLTYRGRSWYVEDLGSTNGSYVNGRRVEGVAPMGFGDELQIGQVRMRLEAGGRMTVDATRAGRPAGAPALPRVLGPIRPRPRWLELKLLGFVAIALLVGSLSLGATVNGSFRLYDAQGMLVYLGALLAAHLAQVLAGRRTDQVLLPTIAMLGGLSLLLMERLPQDLVNQTFFGTTLGLAEVQLVWLLVSLAIATTLGIVVRSDSWLRRYKYTWAAVGVGLLLLTFVFGTVINGQRLTLQIGPLSGQPTELLKVILVVFLAGYLSENRALIVEQDTRLGPLRLPPLPYLAPMLAMWAIALVIVVIQRDLGAALLFFGVFLAMLYVATGRISLVIIGLVLFLFGSALMANLIDHVRTRVDIWLDPFADPLGAGLPGRPGAARLRARRPAGGRSRRRAAGDRRTTADPERPHGLPARRAR